MITKELVCLNSDTSIKFIKPVAYLDKDLSITLSDNNVFIFIDATKSYRQYRLLNELKQYINQLGVVTLFRNSAIIYLNLLGRDNIKPFIEDGVRKVDLGNYILDEKLRLYRKTSKSYASPRNYIDKSVTTILDGINLGVNMLELFYLFFSNSNDYNPYSGEYSIALKKNTLLDFNNMCASNDLVVVKSNRQTTSEFTHKMYDLNVLLKESYHFDDLMFDLNNKNNHSDMFEVLLND